MVLRSPVYAHHDPIQLDPDGRYTYMGPGRPDLHLQRLYPHRGSWEGGRHRAARRRTQPTAHRPHRHRPPCGHAAALRVVRQRRTAHGHGHRAQAGRDAEQTMGSNGLVVRAYETAGAATHATIALPAWSCTIEADFRPGEIKTWRVSANGTPVEVNLLEEPKQR